MVKPTKCAEPSKTDEIFVANMTQFSCAKLDELQNAFDRVMLRSDLMNSKHMIMILQKSIPFDASSEKPLPGISPLDPDQWLMIDDSYGAQMLLRQELITTKRDQVIAIDPAALPAARELLWQVVDYFTRTCAMQYVDGVIQTPDGRRVPVDYDDPMGCMGQIAQNDFAIMEQRGEEHLRVRCVAPKNHGTRIVRLTKIFFGFQHAINPSRYWNTSLVHHGLCLTVFGLHCREATLQPIQIFFPNTSPVSP